MKILIAGGGTGGHLFPGIAVAEEFLSRDPANEVLFVGTSRGIEAKVLPGLGYRLEQISAAGVRGKTLWAQIKGWSALLYGYARSREIIKTFRPDMVLGVGGYASAPAVLAARGLKVPCFVHEQNAIPGMTNKLLAKFALKNFISIEESRSFFPEETTLLSGNPLRRQILDQVSALEETSNSAQSEFHLLVFGGSLGAQAINSVMVAVAPLLQGLGRNLTITHQTGEKDHQQVTQGYRNAGINANVTPFIADMAAAYRQADLIVCRAGATTIAEVTACGKPCIFIPYPYAVDDHQRKNAESLVNAGAAFMILENAVDKEVLAAEIGRLMADQQLLVETGSKARGFAKVDAAKVIVDEMLALSQGK